MDHMVTTNQNLQQIHKSQRERNTSIPIKKNHQTTREETKREEQRRTTKTTRKEVTRVQRQNGGVEGHELPSSYKNTKITTKCWTTIDKKMLEPTKKDTLHPKTKKKPQDSRRGTIVIKSNLIPTEWVTNKLEDNYTTEILPQEWKFWAPHQVPQPWGLVTGRGVPRESGFEVTRVSSQKFHRTGGNGNSTIGGCK